MPSASQFIQILEADARLLQLVDQNFADSARRSGPHLVCHPGCTQCCYGAFATSPLDALRLRTGMAAIAAADPARAAAIAERAQAYLAQFQIEFPGDPITGILGSSDQAQAAFEDFANHAACPALNPATGLCEVYEYRPMTCRVFGPPIRTEAEESDQDASEDEALAVCELCFTTATEAEIAAAEMQIPHDEEAQLNELVEADPNTQPGETIVAYCLVV